MRHRQHSTRIAAIDPRLLQPVIEGCEKIDWYADRYVRRREPDLIDGRIIELPFVIVTGINLYTQPEIDLMQASLPLISWLMSLTYSYRPPFSEEYILMRGEFGTMLPGKQLKWHDDRGVFHLCSTRVHVPIVTNPHALQLWEDHEEHYEVGYVYEYDNIRPHSTINGGDRPRTHLIIDLLGKHFANRLVNRYERGFLDKFDAPLDPQA